MEHPTSPIPSQQIRVVVAYPWGKNKDNDVLHPLADKRWKSLREKIGSAIKSIVTTANNRPGGNELDIRIERLRGHHGQILLHTLRHRIERADVLIGSGVDGPRSRRPLPARARRRGGQI